jgi:hypothetical protein
MIQNGSHPKGLYVFFDTDAEHFTCKEGPGTASIRPYNKYSSRLGGPPRAAGICVSFREILGGGFTELSPAVKAIIDRDFEEIENIFAAGSHDCLVYLADKQCPTRLDTSPFNVHPDVDEYIIDKLQAFDGRLLAAAVGEPLPRLNQEGTSAVAKAAGGRAQRASSRIEVTAPGAPAGNSNTLPCGANAAVAREARHILASIGAGPRLNPAPPGALSLQVTGVPPSANSDILQNILGTVARSSPTLQGLLQSVVILPSGAQQAARVYHASFATSDVMANILRELRHGQHSVRDDPSFATPVGPVTVQGPVVGNPDDDDNVDGVRVLDVPVSGHQIHPLGNGVASAAAAGTSAAPGTPVGALFAGVRATDSGMPAGSEEQAPTAAGCPPSHHPPETAFGLSFLASERDVGTDCLVCTEPVTAGALMIRLPCLHVFHLFCAERWLLPGLQREDRSCRCPECNVAILQLREPTG